MPDIEVIIFNQKLKLSYQESEKERLMNAVEVLNKNWNKFSDLHGKVSDLKIITLITLELQDSIEDVKALKDKLNLQELSVESLKKEIEIKNKKFKDSIEEINKFKSELDNKNEEISKIENIIDEIHDELLHIKRNILTNYEWNFYSKKKIKKNFN